MCTEGVRIYVGLMLEFDDISNVLKLHIWLKSGLGTIQFYVKTEYNQF